MSVFSVKRTSKLSLGESSLDDSIPGFELGDFIVIYGHNVLPTSFVLSVRCQLPTKLGGLDSSAVFIDASNSFNPYLLAEIALDHYLDPQSVLERVYISRAFTAYQLCSLILEKLEIFLKSKKAKLLIASDIISLFLSGIPKDEAEDLFTKICKKFSEIVAGRQTIIIVNRLHEKKSRQVQLLENILFERANVLTRLEKKGKILSFILEKHSCIKAFGIDLPTDYTNLSAYMEA